MSNKIMLMKKQAHTHNNYLFIEIQDGCQSPYCLNVAEDVAYLHTTTGDKSTTTTSPGCLLTGCEQEAECVLAGGDTGDDAGQYMCRCVAGYTLDDVTGSCVATGLLLYQFIIFTIIIV